MIRETWRKEGSSGVSTSRIWERKRSTFICSIWLLLMLGTCWVAGQTGAANPSPDSGYVRVYYNKLPDSLFFNGKPITPDKKTRLNIKGGILRYRAVLDCHHAINDSILVVPGRNNQVPLIFKHFTSPDLWVYRLRNLETLGIVGIAGGFASSQVGRKFALPILGAGLVQQHIWKRMASKRIDPCSAALLTPNFAEKWGAIQIGLVSYGHYGLDADFEMEFRKAYVTSFGKYYLDYRLRGKASGNYTGSYGLKIGAFKGVAGGWAQIRLAGSVFPTFRFGGEITDSLYFFEKMKTTSIETKKPLFVGEVNADLKVWGGLNKAVFLSFGFCASNRISMTHTYQLEIPNFITRSEGDKSYGARISYRVIGSTIGLNYQYRLSNRVGMYCGGDYGSETRAELTEYNIQDTRFSFTSGLYFVL